MTKKQGRSAGAGLLMAVAAACSVAEPGEDVGTEAAALGSNSITISVAVPAGRDASEVGLAATRSLTFGNNVIAARAEPGRDQLMTALVSNTGTGLTKLGNDSYAGDISSRGPVTIGDRSRVGGFVRSSGSIQVGAGSVIGGSRLANVPVAPPVVSSHTVTRPSQSAGDVMLEPGQQRTITPRRYGNLVVKPRSKLRLSAGDYFVDTLDLEPQGTLELDQGQGLVRVYLRTTLIFRGDVRAVDGSFPRFLLAYTGTNELILEAPFFGTLVAPNAVTRLRSLPVPHSGQFFGRDLNLDAGTRVALLPRTECGLPFLPGNIDCDDGNPCTRNDHCANRVCVGEPTNVCPADACHAEGICNPESGSCDAPLYPDGTFCSVGEVGAEGMCRAGHCETAERSCRTPAKHTRWQTGQGGWPSRPRWLSGDFDGDQRVDLALAFRDGDDISIDVHTNEYTPAAGGLFGIERWATSQGGFPDENEWGSGDFDADGRSDLAMAFEDGDRISIDVHLSVVVNGRDEFVNERWQTRTGGWPAQRQWLSGDFNGDGLDDMIMPFESGGSVAIDLHPNLGGEFGIERWPTGPAGWPGTFRWLKGDFDGDGRLDLALAFEEGGLISLDVHLNRGGSFEHRRWEDGQTGWNHGAGAFLSGDFDDDGDDDIAFAFEDHGLVSIDLHASERDRFEPKRVVNLRGGWPGVQSWVAGDYDANGHTDLALAFDDGDLISVDVHAFGDFLGSCLPTAVAWQGFLLDDSTLDPIGATEMNGIANEGEDWYWSAAEEINRVLVGDLDGPSHEHISWPSNFQDLTGDCDEVRGYNHFGDADFHDGKLFVPVTGECVPNALLVFDRDLRLLGWGTLGKGGGAWASIHPKDGWLYTSGSKNPLGGRDSIPIPPGPSEDFTVIRAYDTSVLHPADGNIAQMLSTCTATGCPDTDLGYIGHLQIIPGNTPLKDYPWDSFWIQGGDISPNGVLYYAYDHKRADSSLYTGAHAFDLVAFGTDVGPSAEGVRGENAHEIRMDGDEGRGYMSADYDGDHSAWFLGDTDWRADELEGITAYRAVDGRVHVIMLLLSNAVEGMDVSLYHWTTNEP